jgi:hypothetical protein
MDSAIKNLLPVTLRSGDADNGGTVDFDDIIFLSGVFVNPNTPFGAQDMNLDGLINRTDIIHIAGNMGLSDAPNGPLAEHVLYGLGRDLSTSFIYPNSRIWLGMSG